MALSFYFMEGLEDYKKAGKLARDALNHGLSMIKPGVKIVNVLDEVENYIIRNGGGIAFPAQISLNDIAAHQCSVDSEEVIGKDLIKLDVGAHVNGFIGDNARTVSLNGREDLVEASDAALDAALSVIKPGVTIGEVGRVIQREIEKRGFKPVRNLSGHGLARFKVHTSPSMPNFDTKDDTVLEEGMVVAIEPFASEGSGIVQESGNATVYSLVNKKPVRSMITRNVLKDLDELPFTTRWLIKKYGEGRVNFAIRELEQKDLIRSHPPLRDTSKGLVSQSEHTVYVADEPIILTK